MVRLRATLCLLLLCIWLDCHLAAKILLIPALHHSHVNLFSVNGRALKDAGHNVMVLTSHKLKGPVLKHNVKHIINPISDSADFTRWMDKNLESASSQSFLTTLRHLTPIFAQLCEETNRNQELMKLIASQNFDLIIIDGFAMRHCMYTIPYRFSIPYILFSTVPDPWSSGVSAMPSVEPSILQPFTNDLDFFQRLKNTMNFLLLYSGIFTRSFDEKLIKEFAPNKAPTTLRELHHGAEMTLINLEVMCLDYPRVSMPHYQFVGGSVSSPTSPLEEDLLAWVKGAPSGVIVVSLGSSTALQQIWDTLEDKLMDAIGRLTKYRAVVQRDVKSRTSVREIPVNVRCLAWLPQNDILGHPRTRLFITHGGNNGQIEAVYHAVPMLTLPIWGDQFYNGLRVTARGYGLNLDVHSSTAEDIYGAAMELLNNNTYTKNIRKCSDIIRSQPTARDKVVYWTEHILRFGGAHLKPLSLNMPLSQFLLIDVILFVSFILTTLAIGLVIFIVWLSRKVQKMNVVKKQKCE